MDMQYLMWSQKVDRLWTSEHRYPHRPVQARPRVSAKSLSFVARVRRALAAATNLPGPVAAQS